MATDNRDIFAFIEAYDGVPTQGARRIVGKCRQLADELGCHVEAIYPFEKEPIASEIIQLGADICYQPRGSIPSFLWDKFLLETVSTLKPEFLIFPATPTCNTVAGTIAGTRNLPLLLNCVSLTIDAASRTLRGGINLFNESIQASLSAEKIDPQIATLRSKKLPEPYLDTTRSGISRRLEYTIPSIQPHILEEKIRPPDLTKQSKIAVLVGSKVSREEDLRLIDTFCHAVNASIVSSKNWLDQEKNHKLLSGAKLLLSIEADYDPSILLQLSSACRVIAINSDKEAKIADVAHIFIQGDFRRVLTSLTERWKENPSLSVT